MNWIRSFFVSLFSLSISVIASGPLQAQEVYPTKPIRMVVPFAPGGVTDLAARAISERLTPLLAQTILVDNRGGAGGAIGAMLVVKAPADGYTLLFSANGTTLVLPALDPTVQFDAVRDFTAVAMAVRIPLVLAAAPSLGISDVKGLRELLVANPSKFA